VAGGLTLAGWQAFGLRTKQAADTCLVTAPISNSVPGQVAISESDNGQTIDLQQGDRLVVVVKYITGTGYGWNLKSLSDPTIITRETSIYNPDGS
jgi:predicted secreted protein